MKHRGMRTYRLKDNPEEKRFAQAWSEQGNILAYLLDERPVQGGRPPTPSDRDELVAATVIQWLGSPVGQHFLSNVGWTRKPGSLAQSITDVEDETILEGLERLDREGENIGKRPTLKPDKAWGKMMEKRGLKRAGHGGKSVENDRGSKQAIVRPSRTRAPTRHQLHCLNLIRRGTHVYLGYAKTLERRGWVTVSRVWSAKGVDRVISYTAKLTPAGKDVVWAAHKAEGAAGKVTSAEKARRADLADGIGRYDDKDGVTEERP
jgi:hypothetical protein